MSRVKSNPQLALRPQDLVVLLRLALAREAVPTYAVLGRELGMTASEVHAAVDRGMKAQLIFKDVDGRPFVQYASLRQFVIHGARYCFPPVRGGLTRGTPTGYAAAPLNATIVQSVDPIPVWPYYRGASRGVALHPLYPSVPEAAERNPALGELLALFDAIRAGSVRERNLATQLIEQRLQA